jgi:hypothetical protein
MRHGLKPGQVAIDRRGGPAGPVALLLPGENFTADMPPLHYTSRTLQAHRWTVEEVWWRAPSDDAKGWALRETARLITQTQPALVVGKSLGTFGLPAAVAAGCAGVWLTPLLHAPELASVRLDARHLLIGGTADRSWDSAVAADSGAQVMEIAGADHALALNDVPASIKVLADLQQRIDAYLGGLPA